MKLSRRVARFNRLVTNRIQGLYAWLLPPWAVILHQGRRSGRRYRTPVLAFRCDETLVIALVYGQESDWLRNLQAGGGQVIRAGRSFRVGLPKVIETSDAADLARLSPLARSYCRRAKKLAVLEIGEPQPGFGPRWSARA
jgi:deazaflavin-dependent oxidoreductase (nitroreductase family)